MNRGIWMTLIGISVAVVSAFAAIALIAKRRQDDEFDDAFDYDDMLESEIDADYEEEIVHDVDLEGAEESDLSDLADDGNLQGEIPEEDLQ